MLLLLQELYIPLRMEGKSARVHKASNAKSGGSCGLLPLMAVIMVFMLVLMLVPISMVMLVSMVMFVGISMPMGVLLPFCIFHHGMPMTMMTVLMIVVVLVVIVAQLTLLGVMLNALVMTVCCLMLLHGCGSSNCASVLALDVEVGNQRLCFSAKDLLKV